MPKKLAIDWDDAELRLVVANCSGSSVKVIDAAVIPIDSSTIKQTLQSAVQRRGLEKSDALVVIGRGKAELRELKLPPVPDEELPDMVRFQAIRSFASAGESATVDYLVTGRTDSGIELIAAAIGPAKLDEIRDTCEAGGVTAQRIALRPLATASLFLSKSPEVSGDTVLIDLLASDAEIVIARDGRVVFVRTVRLPNDPDARPGVLAGELRRSLVACGSTDASSRRIILWGRASVHKSDVAKISETTGSAVETLDPFSLVDVDRKLENDLPDHVGRLAPLVGLLASDENASDRLIDFLNPRRRPEAKSNRQRTALLVGLPAAVVLLIGWLIYSQLSGLDSQIEQLQAANAAQKQAIEQSETSVSRVERVDEFLDGDVNWLSEFRRIAEKMPPADKMIIRSVSANTLPRSGGGQITLAGAVTDQSVIVQLEESLRDEAHRVVGEGSSQQNTDDAYRWEFRETITIAPESIRADRYEGLAPVEQPPPVDDSGAADGPATRDESASADGSTATAASQPEASDSADAKSGEDANAGEDTKAGEDASASDERDTGEDNSVTPDRVSAEGTVSQDTVDAADVKEIQ